MICAELPQRRNQELSYRLRPESFKAVNRSKARGQPGLFSLITGLSPGEHQSDPATN
ncbi:MAG: Uncharacterised protein [Synechococcus sp. CC9902]|nr:MAG: Uncharacterised protein [Synechococcus sp. CC9902]